MKLRQNNQAMALAIVAAFINLAFTIWPAVPQVRGEAVFSWWSLTAIAVSVLYLVAAWFCDSSPGLSRILLIAGAVVEVASSIFSGVSLSPDGRGTSIGA